MMFIYWWKHKNYIKTNTETPLDASKDAGLEVNIEKSKWVIPYQIN
jgi:hypothetical protein